MGIDVRIETERGEMLAEVPDPQGRTNGLLPTSSADGGEHCLRFVDPYGDTVFNRLQIPVLVDEVRQQLARIQEPALRQHGEAVLRLIESVREPHVYVRFFGD